MALENEVEVVEDNKYANALDSQLHREYDDGKAEYKQAIKLCHSKAERRRVTNLYMEDLMDLAIDAQEEQDWELRATINLRIKALQRRVYAGNR
tara:strand:+ start:10411 stop:10692 length:282 start_codon:yes stop_codon:yes gene_type:complete